MDGGLILIAVFILVITAVYLTDVKFKKQKVKSKKKSIIDNSLLAKSHTHVYLKKRRK